jgi:uncharacterized damage-inducible protein DinB
MQIDIGVLVDYTDWERQKWHAWLRQHPEALKISMGANCDTRFQVVGDLVRHIFSAEKRYVERLSDQPLTDTAGIPNDNVETLFQFGQQSRLDLKNVIQRLPAPDWDAMKGFDFFGGVLKATPKKIVAHVLTHEIRHWGQVASMCRLNGFKGEFHDLLFSPVLGGEFRREQAKTSS